MAKKIFTIMLAALVSFSALSATKEEAEMLFTKRGLEGESRTYSKQAAKIALDLASETRNVLEKAELLTLASKFLYFQAFIMNSKKEKKAQMKVYWDGYEAGLKAVNLLGDNKGNKKSSVNPTKPEYTKQLAAGMAWMGSNIGRWGKLRGVFSALGKWRKILKPRLQDIFRIDPTTEDYVAHRIAGGVLNTLGGTIDFNGTEKNALTILEEAYNETLVEETEGFDIETSNSMSTNIFYLDALRKAGKVDKFCEVYDNINDIFSMVEDDASVLDVFAPFAAESPIEYEVNFKGEKAFHKYYSNECE